MRFTILPLLLVTAASCVADPELDDEDVAAEEATEAFESAEPLAASRDDLWAGTSGCMNLWDDNGFSDTHLARTDHDSTFKNDGFNDKASSLVNKTGSYWRIYEDTGYEGYSVCIRPHSHITNLKDHWAINGSWGDHISSMKRISSSSHCLRILGDRN
jgi:Peptidase inhibitor family I36